MGFWGGGFSPPGGERGGISKNGLRHKLPTTQTNLYTKFHENPSITLRFGIFGGGFSPPGGEQGGILKNGLRHKLPTTQTSLYTKFHENPSITLKNNFRLIRKKNDLHIMFFGGSGI